MSYESLLEMNTFVYDTFQLENLMETMLNDAFRNYRQDAANLDESDMVETKYVLNEWARVDNGGFL